MRAHLFLVFACFSLLWTWPTSAAAGELAYDAPAECPARGAVIARAAARAPHGRDAKIVVVRTADGFGGDVSIGAGDSAVERHVEGRTCAAVVDALVLVLALDHASPDAAPGSAGEAVAADAGEPSAKASAASVTSAASVASPGSEAALVTGGGRPAVRSPIEIAVGQDLEHREVVASEVTGFVLFGELAAPGLLGWSRYRPSTRASLGVLSSLGRGGFSSTTYMGGGLQVCPLGVAVISSDRVDLTLSACGVLNAALVGAAEKAAWFDGGGVARAAVQIGRKDHVRFFVEVSGGMLGQIGTYDAQPGNGQQLPDATTTGILIGSNSYSYPVSFKRFGTLALGAGVVFP